MTGSGDRHRIRQPMAQVSTSRIPPDSPTKTVTRHGIDRDKDTRDSAVQNEALLKRFRRETIPAEGIGGGSLIP